jgi:glycosyltransferase involved in cell wall biosynthesis
MDSPVNRIALCIECPLEQHGGVEILVRALIPGLAASKSVYLVSDDDSTAMLQSRFGPNLAGHFHWDPAYHSREQIDRLISWGRENRIDLFHFHHGGTYGWNSRSWSLCPITEVSRAGFRCVSTNHGAFGFWLFVGAQRSLLYRLLAMTICWPAKLRQLAAVDWEATVSKHNFKTVRRWFFPMRGRIRQVYHSVLSESPSISYQFESKIILSLATICENKGQEVLTESFCRIASDFPEWRLRFIGRSTDASIIERIRYTATSSNLTHRVEILGETDNPQAALANASIYAQPSFSEAFGLSLQEAAYAGIACVGSAVGGIPELILHGKTGFTFPAGDSKTLAETLARMMNSRELREEFGKAGRKHIQDNKMTAQGMIQHYISLYQE